MVRKSTSERPITDSQEGVTIMGTLHERIENELEKHPDVDTYLVKREASILGVVEAFASRLNEIEHREYFKRYPDSKHPADTVAVKEKQKFIYINIGTSGAWLVEKATGEIFNIKAYGVPDHNKKAKANLGNVRTADPEIVWRGRYNYLR
jgi:hypothetical protein